MIEIVQQPAHVVIGVPVLAPFDRLSALVPEAWTTAFERLQGEGRVFAEASVRIGDEYHEVVGVLARTDERIDGLVHALVPGGDYGHVRYEGPAAGIAAAFGEIEAWLHSTGRRPGAAKLDIGYTPDGTDTVHDLFVSLG